MNFYKSRLKSKKKNPLRRKLLKKNIIKLIKKKIHFHALEKLGLNINIYKNLGGEWQDMFNDLKADTEEIIDFLARRQAFGIYQKEKERFYKDVFNFSYVIVVTFPVKINNMVTNMTASCILQKTWYPNVNIGTVWWIHEVAKFPLHTQPSLIPIMMNIAEEIIKHKNEKLYLLVKYPKIDSTEKSYQQKMDDFNWLSNRYKSVYNYKILPNYQKTPIYENVYMIMYKNLNKKNITKKTLKILK